MRTLILLLAVIMLTACRSQKEQLLQESAEAVDSVAQTHVYRSISVTDSLRKSASFDFDSLEVTLIRHNTCAMPEADSAAHSCIPARQLGFFNPAMQNFDVVKVKAVNGSIRHNAAADRNMEYSHNKVDSASYTLSKAQTTSEEKVLTDNKRSIALAFVIIVVIITALFYPIITRR